MSNPELTESATTMARVVAGVMIARIDDDLDHIDAVILEAIDTPQAVGTALAALLDLAGSLLIDGTRTRVDCEDRILQWLDTREAFIASQTP